MCIKRVGRGFVYCSYLGIQVDGQFIQIRVFMMIEVGNIILDCVFMFRFFRIDIYYFYFYLNSKKIYLVIVMVGFMCQFGYVVVFSYLIK